MRRSLLAPVGAIAVACGTLFSPPPSGTPRVTEFVIPTRSPAPSVSPTAFTGHYGFLEDANSGLAVRREEDPAPLRVLDARSGAVSPDGRIFAGWADREPFELRLFDVATGATETVVTLGAAERFTAVTWSLDGQGLLYSVAGNPSARPGPPAYSALRAVLIRQQPKEILRYDDGSLLIPALWDRLGGELVTAFVTEPGIARGYVVVRGSVPPIQRRFPDGQDWQATPAVSGDGQYVVIAALTQPVLRIFQAADPTFVVEYHGADGGTSAIGRPGTADNAIVVDGTFLLWDPSKGRIRRGTASDVTAVRFFRFDGSAAVVVTASLGPALIDVASGSLTRLRGSPRYAVRLP
jgi:hypothetical protein